MTKQIDPFNIYLCGVGGQGIGLLCEILLRSCDYAGYQAKAVDTHGLAQRGGVVVSHLRLGKSVYSPMVSARQAHLVVALERHEAMRGADFALQDGGVLIYYNTVLQPLGVRLGRDKEVSEQTILTYCKQRKIDVHSVSDSSISDHRMQNIAVLANIHNKQLIPQLEEKHFLKAMGDLMSGEMLDNNIELFQSDQEQIA
jgi:indolepyruvate ferredoxin oxidoreductase beta subunit